MVNVKEKRAGDFNRDGRIVFLVASGGKGLDIVVGKKGFEFVARGGERDAELGGCFGQAGDFHIHEACVTGRLGAYNAVEVVVGFFAGCVQRLSR